MRFFGDLIFAIILLPECCAEIILSSFFNFLNLTQRLEQYGLNTDSGFTYQGAEMMEGGVFLKVTFSGSVFVNGQQLTQIKTVRVSICREVKRITLRFSHTFKDTVKCIHNIRICNCCR